MTSLTSMQKEYRDDLQKKYQEQKEALFTLNKQVKEQSRLVNSFFEKKDAAGRTIIYYRKDGEGRDLRTSKVYRDSCKISLQAKSNMFQKALVDMKAIHFQCRDHKLPTDYHVFRFLDRWKMISRRQFRDKNPKHKTPKS